MSKKPKIFLPQAATANDAANGLVVFRAPSGEWVKALEDAHVAETEPAAETLLAAAMQDAVENRVVEPYLIDVAREGGTIRALKLREAIRAEGPTVGFAVLPEGSALASS